MDTLFMNSKNSETPDPRRLLVNLSAKINLKEEINMLLYQILAYTIHGKILKKSYKNNKFKISTPTWNEKFALLDGSYSVSDIQDYFEYILKNMEKKLTILQ